MRHDPSSKPPGPLPGDRRLTVTVTIDIIGHGDRLSGGLFELALRALLETERDGYVDDELDVILAPNGPAGEHHKVQIRVYSEVGQ